MFFYEIRQYGTRFILKFERKSLERGVGVYFPLGFPLHLRPLKPRLPEPDPGREPGWPPLAAPRGSTGSGSSSGSRATPTAATPGSGV
jgi:hypothetical protein